MKEITIVSVVGSTDAHDTDLRITWRLEWGPDTAAVINKLYTVSHKTQVADKTPEQLVAVTRDIFIGKMQADIDKWTREDDLKGHALHTDAVTFALGAI